METNNAQQQQQPQDSASDLISQGLSANGGSQQPPQQQQQQDTGRRAEPAQQQQQAAPSKTADAPKPEDEIASLRKEIEALKRSPSALEEQRRDYDAREDFINEIGEKNDIPRSMLRSFIPPTRDKAAMYRALETLSGHFKQYIDSCVRKGTLRYINVGGDAGGKGMEGFRSPVANNTSTSPTDLIAQGLSQGR